MNSLDKEKLRKVEEQLSKYPSESVRNLATGARNKYYDRIANK